MKISAELREFARLNPPPPPQAGEGDSPAASGERAVENGTPSAETAEEGMAAMSELYRAGGNELYIGANGREHD